MSPYQFFKIGQKGRKGGEYSYSSPKDHSGTQIRGHNNHLYL